MAISKCLEKSGYLISKDKISKAMLREMLAEMQRLVKAYGHCHLELSVFAQMPKRNAKPWKKSKNYTHASLRANVSYRRKTELNASEKNLQNTLSTILRDD